MEQLQQAITELAGKHDRVNEKMIRFEMRLNGVEVEVSRTIKDVKSIMTDISDINKTLHRVYYTFVGMVILSLAQDFGIMEVMKKLFL